MSDKPKHPGEYIRSNVIPAEMNVKDAAVRLDVSRPTLSKLLNGRADLSPDMAARLETAFGVSARKLLDLQSDWDAAHSNRTQLASAIKSYVPPFLQIKAAKIEQWGSTGLLPRQRLAVFLRTLVNSTGAGLTKVDFPGNDDSERPGWDGEVHATEATPWVPAGHSGWEFGTNENVKKKADGDFAKSVAGVDADERKQMTFVFVTPRSWPGKAAWIKENRAKKLWKDVRAYDSSDLEQWLEQSIPAQAWFANETEQAAGGTISLDEASKRWAADCEPALAPSLFDEAIASYRSTLERVLSTSPFKPTVIAADSRDEALAFLSAALQADDTELGLCRDRIIVFSEPGTLAKLAAQPSNFIPVILSREVEKEFAPFRTAMPSFIVYPRNAASEPDISLETLSYDSFEKALRTMGLDDERIRQLSRESGRSPTVLRRRLSQMQAIKTPDWSADRTIAQSLIPFLFAGAWKSDNTTDQAILEFLAGEVPFEELERRLSSLLPLDSAPVWAIGSFRGIVSKIDALFAISEAITAPDLQRFFEVAGLVLSEDNPALDLPDDKRWAAGIYGKTRQISGALREGLAETLVLLAVHGPALFKPRGFDTATHAERLVESLLLPLNDRTLEAQIDNLPLYAEAAPEKFLSIIEADLKSEDPQTLKLMRPVGDSLFGSSPRTGVLWALENLAWSEPLFMRTVLVLGKLGETVIDDNLSNKPVRSLSSIFRSWMPQTSANLELRKAALTKLVQQHPTVGWQICIEQFDPHSRMGDYSHKPRWRPDGHGHGNVLTRSEANDFQVFAFKLAVNWTDQTRDTITDLINNLGGVDEAMKLEVWDLVDRWSVTASEADKASVREKIRVSTMTRGARLRRGAREKVESDERAREAYHRLAPSDPVFKHAWLFKQAWVEESADELEDDDLDYEKRDERMAKLKESALREVFDTGGIDAVLQLAENGQAAHNVGWFLATIISTEAALVEALLTVVHSDQLSGSRANVVSGALHKADQRGWNTLGLLVGKLPSSEAIEVLLLAPFKSTSWDIVESLGAAASQQYWANIQPGWNRDSQDLVVAVSRLVEAGRPRAAFQFAHFDLKELPPRSLFDVLIAVARSAEPPKTYMLDQHHLREAFKLLNASGQMTTDELAGLEFQYIEIFDEEDETRPINLERRIAQQPELFVHAIAFAFKRDDGGKDPPELQIQDDEQRSNRASAAYRLLEKVRQIPGESVNGEIDKEKLTKWIEEVRSACGSLARQDIGDQRIGKLLSHAPSDADGVWPGLTVRDVLEQVANEHIELGLRTALYNSRGVHFRGEGGSEERQIAAKYGRWADAIEYTHPRVAAILRNMERSYIRDAEWEDNDAKIARRMRY